MSNTEAFARLLALGIAVEIKSPSFAREDSWVIRVRTRGTDWQSREGWGRDFGEAFVDLVRIMGDLPPEKLPISDVEWAQLEKDVLASDCDSAGRDAS